MSYSKALLEDINRLSSQVGQRLDVSSLVPRKKDVDTEDWANIGWFSDEEDEYYRAYHDIPYQLLSDELTEDVCQCTIDELHTLKRYYKFYEHGVFFKPDQCNKCSYEQSRLKYKLSSFLINKQARFLFGERPDIDIESKTENGQETAETEKEKGALKEALDNVLKQNHFEADILKAAKDCSIAKRVACMLHINETGIQTEFIRATNFIYETSLQNKNELTKFIYWERLKDCDDKASSLIFRKKFYVRDINEGTKENPIIKRRVFVTETVHDGLGKETDTDIAEINGKRIKLKKDSLTELEEIPARIIINDGLIGDKKGVSDIKDLKGYEEAYSRLANLSTDALRKYMNPSLYSTDLDSSTTINVSQNMGGYMDLQSDESKQDKVVNFGYVQADLNFVDALTENLKLVRSQMFNSMDMPDISLDTLQGVITSGKGLKALYWDLIVRCKEKAKTWCPQLEDICEMIIDALYIYPMLQSKYTNEHLPTTRTFKVKVEHKIPLPEDEETERQLDMQAVSAKVMSKIDYIQKWQNVTKEKAAEILIDIATENALFDDSGTIPAESDKIVLAKKIREIGVQIEAETGGSSSTNASENITDFSVDI